MRLILLLIILSTSVYAENQFDGGEYLPNGWVPKASFVDSRPATVTGPAGNPTCTGSNGDNSANGQADWLIVRDSLTRSDLENSSYCNYSICPNAVNSVSITGISRNGSSCPRGYVLIQNYYPGFDNTIHPNQLADGNRSKIARLNFSDSSNWVIDGLTFLGTGAASQNVIRFDGVYSDVTITRNYFKTYPFGQGPGASSVSIAGSCFRCKIQYNFLEGADLTDPSYDFADTHGINVGRSAVKDLGIVQNEIRDVTDCVQLSSNSAGQVGDDFYIAMNDCYIEENYAECDDQNTTPVDLRDDNTCTCSENGFDFKIGASDSKVGEVKWNFLSGYRAQAATSGNDFGCGGTGARENSAIVVHLMAQNIAITANHIWNVGNAVTSGGTYQASHPRWIDFAKNLIWDVNRYYSLSPSPNVVSYGFRALNWDFSRVFQNTIDVQNSPDGCTDMSSDLDFEGNALIGSACSSHNGTTSGNVEDNIYTNGAVQVSGEVDAHIFTGHSLSSFTRYRKPITGAAQDGGHRGEALSIPLDPGHDFDGLYEADSNTNKGPQGTL